MFEVPSCDGWAWNFPPNKLFCLLLTPRGQEGPPYLTMKLSSILGLAPLRSIWVGGWRGLKLEPCFWFRLSI